MAAARRGVLLFLTMADLANVGCIIDGGGGAGRWQPTPSDQAFLDSLLALVQPCCVRNERDTTGREATWKQIMLASGFSRDESLRAACLEELRQLAASPGCLPLPGDADDVCVRVFSEKSGPQQPGQKCANPADCGGRPHELTSCGAGLGVPVCFALTAGVLGSSPCTGMSGLDGQIFVPAEATHPPRQFYCPLKDGLYCDMASRRCATLLPGGSPCAAWQTCASQNCLSGSTAGSGTCEPVVALGENCAQAVCEDGTRCDTINSTCMTRLETGASCQGGSDECVGTCGDDHVCSPVTFEDLVAVDVWCGF